MKRTESNKSIIFRQKSSTESRLKVKPDHIKLFNSRRIQVLKKAWGNTNQYDMMEGYAMNTMHTMHNMHIMHI